METITINSAVADAISHHMGVTPRGKAVALFFNAEKVTHNCGFYDVKTAGYDYEKLEAIKYQFRVDTEVEKRINEAANAKDDDDFFNMETEGYQPKELKWYAVPVMIDSSVRRNAELIEKYTAHVEKDMATMSASNHPEKYAARWHNHMAKLERARFEHDVLLALAARFGVTVNA